MTKEKPKKGSFRDASCWQRPGKEKRKRNHQAGGSGPPFQPVPPQQPHGGGWRWALRGLCWGAACGAAPQRPGRPLLKRAGGRGGQEAGKGFQEGRGERCREGVRGIGQAGRVGNPAGAQPWGRGELGCPARGRSSCTGKSQAPQAPSHPLSGPLPLSASPGRIVWVETSPTSRSGCSERGRLGVQEETGLPFGFISQALVLHLANPPFSASAPTPTPPHPCPRCGVLQLWASCSELTDGFPFTHNSHGCLILTSLMNRLQGRK